MNRSNCTGRTARTLHEAFGPHTSAEIDDTGPHWHDEPLALLIAAAVTVLACWAIVSALFIWSQQ
jgi:hypothetical protein